MPPKSYDSMKSASAAEGIPIELLRKAKALGCSAFRGSRVYIDEAKKFIAENEDELKAEGEAISLKDQKLNEEIRKLRIRNDREEGKSILRASVAESIRKILSTVPVILESRLVNEYPAAVAGLDVPQARVYGKRVCDEVLGKFRELESQWVT